MIRRTAIFCLVAALLLSASLAWAGAKELIIAGNKAAQRGKLKRAIKLFSQAIASKKISKYNLAIAYNNRGSAYADQGRHNKALNDFAKALKANPTFAQTYYNRSFTYEKKGMRDLAIADMRQATLLAPDDKDYKERLQYLLMPGGGSRKRR